MSKKCIGCGILLQSDDVNKEGYVPKEKIKLKEDVICRRCFRLKHYGENKETQEENGIYKLEVNKALKEADIVIPIFDIIDFESSFTNDIMDLLENKCIIAAINKIDLLPSYIHVAEISKWVKYYFTENNIFPEDIAYISAKNKYGVNGIFRKIQYVAKNILKKPLDSNIKIAIIGVSNVGKSHLINLLLNKNSSVVSKFSGTTRKIIKNTKKTKEYTLTIIDTPGLIPDGRLSDLLDSNISYKLVPSNEIPRKTYRFNKNQIFMFENLAYFEILNDLGNKKVIASVYASRDIKFHLTNKNKVKELWNSDFFKLLDKDNLKKYHELEFENRKFTVNVGEDFVISGLGYIEVKRGPLEIEVYLPKDVKAVIRKSISKDSDFEEFDEDDLLWEDF